MWAEFVVGSPPCSEGFSSGTPVILSSRKKNSISTDTFEGTPERFIVLLLNKSHLHLQSDSRLALSRLLYS